MKTEKEKQNENEIETKHSRDSKKSNSRWYEMTWHAQPNTANRRPGKRNNRYNKQHHAQLLPQKISGTVARTTEIIGTMTRKKDDNITTTIGSQTATELQHKHEI